MTKTGITIDLTEEQSERSSEYDASILNHSAVAVQMELDRQDLLNTIRTLENGRKQYYAQLLKEYGYDIAKVARAKVDGGKLHVTLKPDTLDQE